MQKLFLDFETYCDLPLDQVGTYKYVNHPSFHPWCACWAFNNGPVNLWRHGESLGILSDAMLDPDIKFVSYNAEFELAVINAAWPQYEVTSDKFIDVMALACTFGYPLNLDKFCAAIGSPTGKDKKGRALIKKLCVKQKPTAFNPDGRWFPDTAPEDFQDLYEYCAQDVLAMREAYNRLPAEKLSAMETLVWRHTVLQNQRGLPIDIKTVRHIRNVLLVYNKERRKELYSVTKGHVQTGKQVKKIREFLHMQGVRLQNLQAGTVAKVLEKPERLPPVAIRVLELRQLLAHSSTAKFDRMFLSEYLGRVYGNLAYHWAHTGRFAGRGMQIHNLPRATLDDPVATIEMIWDANYQAFIAAYPNVNATCSALIRPCIQASKGYKLIVCDYKSIENVILHWLAGDHKTLEDFRNGIDQYKRYASRRFKVDYDDVTKEQRTYSKPCVLGLGFGGAEGALIYVAKDYGIELDKKAAKVDVNFYRKVLYPMIPKLWYAIYNKAKTAIVSGDPQILILPYTRLEFRYAGGYLFILLPSGRRLSYPQARANDVWIRTIKGRPVQFEAGISYVGLKDNIWDRHGIHPGLMTENIVQGLARDVLCYGSLCAEQGGYPVLATVHDEIITETPDNSGYNIEELCELACTLRSWAKDMPISAEGYEANRYRKE